ncbi:hypothetical protein [Sporomusa rhizae]|uniref:hypothetical protein n=1 Tax=Sporomusa rhizae TaxID=357999 RepID=UPI00352A2B01
MKKIILLAHDPGGYDVVFPVAQKLQRDGNAVDFYTIGPAAKLNPMYSVAKAELLRLIRNLLSNGEICGLVTGTSGGSSLELQAIAACRQAGIPTVAIIDYWSNYRSRFVCPTGEVIYPDYCIVMDGLAKDEAIRDGIPKTIISVLGHPGLDKYTACQTMMRCCSNEWNKVLFLSQPLSAFYGENLGYTEQQALSDCIKVVTKRNNCSLHIKFHPKDAECFQQRYAKIAVSGNLIDILSDYDLVIGMSTMGLLHAVLMGIPAISYQPNLRQQDLCITNKLGLTKLSTSPQELEMLMNSRFDVQVTTNSSVLSQKFIWLDGHSTERVAGFIMEVFK